MPATTKQAKALRLEALREMLAMMQKATPSAPDWYRIIDAVAGSLLTIEIERQEADITPPEE